MGVPFQKDPKSARTYSFDWTDALPESVNIAAVEWTVPDGLTEVTRALVGKVTSIKVTGGKSGCTYFVYADITRSDGDTDRRAFELKVIDAALLSEPSQYREALDAIRAKLAGVATSDQLSYMIGDRQVQRYSRTELLEVEKRFTQLCNDEARRARVRAGGPFFETIPYRFV